MKTVAKILELAAPLQAGFHIRVENEPWMTLVIEDTQERGPNGLPAISVAHYGEQNGDLMRDPEMIFEAEESGEEMNLVPYYWRNDYAGIEQYSASTEDGRTLVNAKLRREHSAFAHVWDTNLKAQGFLEALMNQSTTDEIKGNIHEAKGTVKEKAGQVTNNPNLTAEGRNEKFAGKVEKKVGQIEKVFEK